MYRPKVGEECMVNWHSGELNIHAVITYISDEVGCYKTRNKYSGEEQEYTFAMDSVYFSPIKSKRDEEIDLMMDCSSVSNYSTCSALYDLGYRKQLPYSQFVSIIQCYLITLGYPDSKSLSYSQELANLLGRVEDTL